jgi:hypothetical protein
MDISFGSRNNENLGKVIDTLKTSNPDKIGEIGAFCNKMKNTNVFQNAPLGATPSLPKKPNNDLIILVTTLVAVMVGYIIYKEVVRNKLEKQNKLNIE